NVEYEANGFHNKNKNELRQEAVDFIRSSQLDLVSILLPEDAASSPNSVVDAGAYFSKVANYRKSSETEIEETEKKKMEEEESPVPELRKASVVSLMRERIQSGQFGRRSTLQRTSINGGLFSKI